MPHNEENKDTAERKINQDTKIINEFTRNSENTHNVAISNGVVMAILTLKVHYFGKEANEEEEQANQKKAIEEAIEQCKNELKNVAAHHLKYKEDIDFILSKISEETSSQLDVVTIFLPKTESTTDENRTHKQKILIQLSEVLMLVWKATIGAGMDSEYNTNKKDRLETFFRCLTELRNDKTCHHGIRNALVFTLNYVFPGIELIEDVRSAVMAKLKEDIHQAFWKRYEELSEANNVNNEVNNNGAMKILQSALFNWMSEGTPEQLLALLKKERGMQGSLHDFFKKHGIDPDYIKLNELIDEALENGLEFSHDPKKHPELHLNWIHELLAQEQTPNEAKQLGLETCKNWLKKNYQLDNAEHKTCMATFYSFNTIHTLLIKNATLLSLTGKIEKKVIQEHSTVCENFFKAFVSASREHKINLLTDEEKKTLTEWEALRKTIEDSKKETFQDVIENFFSKWFFAQTGSDTEEKRRLYSLLRSEMLRSKFCWSDEEMKRYFELHVKREGSSNTLELGPYEINRFFLHAIIKKPTEWSSDFVVAFEEILTFVKSKFNQNQTAAAGLLQRDSYPVALLEQLEYLLAEKNNPGSNNRPENMILLPENVRTPEEFLDLPSLMNKENFSSCYFKNHVLFKGLIFAPSTLKCITRSSLRI